MFELVAESRLECTRRGAPREAWERFVTVTVFMLTAGCHPRSARRLSIHPHMLSYYARFARAQHSSTPETVANPSADTNAESEGTTIHTLSEDVLQQVLLHTDFRSLLALKLISCHFRTIVRDTLSSSAAWATARDHFRLLTSSACGDVANLPTKERERLATDFLAALRADDVRTVEVLLHLGRISAQDPVFSATDPETSAQRAYPLHFAHSSAMVALLYSYKAEVDARRSEGTTPLMDAACAGEGGVVRALCEYGANVHLRNGSRASSLAIHQAENCDLRRSFLRSTLPPDDSLWRFPSDFATASSRHRVVPDGAACIRVLVRFGAVREL